MIRPLSTVDKRQRQEYKISITHRHELKMGKNCISPKEIERRIPTQYDTLQQIKL